MNLLLSILLSLTSLMSVASEQSSTIIYGDDNRDDVGNVIHPLYLRLAESTAAMVNKSKLTEFNAEQVVLKGENLQTNGICQQERFSSQPAVANCSGFLVSDNIIITAGHCFQKTDSCSNFSWVFDFKADRENQAEVVVDKSNVYSCKKVLNVVLDDTETDYAVIELDRKVLDRKPLKMRTSGKPNIGDELVVIGHPSGLPTKIAGGAKVRSINSVYLVANLDTYGGNSGSAVFNAKSGLVEGILVRGGEDYVADPETGTCGISNHVSNDEGRGEDVTLITKVTGIPTI